MANMYFKGEQLNGPVNKVYDGQPLLYANSTMGLQYCEIKWNELEGITSILIKLYTRSDASFDIAKGNNIFGLICTELMSNPPFASRPAANKLLFRSSPTIVLPYTVYSNTLPLSMSGYALFSLLSGVYRILFPAPDKITIFGTNDLYISI